MIFHKHYLVSPTGETAAKIKAFIATRHTALLKRQEIQKDLGFENIYSDNRGVVHGASFSDSYRHMNTIRPGWRRIKADPDGMLRPDTKTEEGKRVMALFAECTLQQAEAFQELIGPDCLHFTGCKTDEAGARGGIPIGYIIYERIGEQLILLVPTMGKPEEQWIPPSDCTFIKTSSYYRIREEAGIEDWQSPH
jgi:hypothetical protein